MHLWHLISRSKNTTGIFSQNVLGADTNTSEAPQYGQFFRPIRRISSPYAPWSEREESESTMQRDAYREDSWSAN
jgi:hypothetical protein